MISGPSEIDEFNDPSAADEVYQAWTNYLLAKTRDKQIFNLLFKDLTNYGFRRNLWGLKSRAIVLICLLITINYVYGFYVSQTANFILFPAPVIYAELSLVVILVFWLLVITREWIWLSAFAYAERLCEASELI